MDGEDQPAYGVDLSVDIAPRAEAGLRLRHPILVAAGGAGYGNELIESVGAATPGAIITRSVTREAHPGNPPPRMVPLPDGLISSIGVPDSGIESVLRRQAGGWSASDVPIIVSICADTASDISALAGALDAQPGVAGIELNLASPDRSRRGMAIGIDVAASELATVAARAATQLPLVVKLVPEAHAIREVARAVSAAGADAISAIGAVTAMALAHDRSGPALGTQYGGLSGPAIKSVGLRVVYEISQVVDIPIIGIGGISALEDVLDYLAVGATAVAMATAALARPSLPGAIATELAAWCGRRGIGTVQEVSGTALPHRRDRGSLRNGPYRL